MLEAGLREGLRSSFRRVVWSGRRPSGARAEPGGEAALLGDRGEGVVGFTGAEREFLAARFPAEFFDELRSAERARWQVGFAERRTPAGEEADEVPYASVDAVVDLGQGAWRFSEGRGGVFLVLETLEFL